MEAMKEYLTQQLLYCGNKALESTVQLFYKAKPIGSGILINFHNRSFLVSAAHVLEPEFIQDMTIPNGSELVQIEGEMVITQVPIRVDDKIDLAIVQLNNLTINQLEQRFNFLKDVNIDFEHEQLPSHQYMFCGYPIESTLVDRNKAEIFPTPLKVRTKITERILLNIPQYPMGSKWILDYQRTKQENVNSGKKEFSPHPKGLSGGGLWSTPCDPNIAIEETSMKLVGIMTDYFDRSDQVVCATNIRLVREIICKKFI